MEIEWKSEKTAPYLFRQEGNWPGVHIHRARVQPGRLLEHTNPCHELNVAISGKLITEKFSATGRHVTTYGSSSNLCVTPAGQPIRAEWNKQLDNLGIFIDPELMNRTAIENGLPDGFEFRELYQHHDPLIQHLGLMLLDSLDSKEPVGRMYSDSLIQTLTLHLLTNYGTTKPTKQLSIGGLSGHKLRLVKEFVRENLDSDLGLADIAAVANLSQFHFARSFRKSTGLTPQQFVMQQRIERAKELLTQEDLPIVEVSLLTGFKNQSHFTSLFRKFTRLTPKIWRESFVR